MSRNPVPVQARAERGRDREKEERNRYLTGEKEGTRENTRKKQDAQHTHNTQADKNVKIDIPEPSALWLIWGGPGPQNKGECIIIYIYI